jgi:hypothetical protein
MTQHPDQPDIFALKDEIKKTKMSYYQGTGATYDDMVAAARAYLEAVRAAEKRRLGRARTRITPQTIAHLLR